MIIFGDRKNRAKFPEFSNLWDLGRIPELARPNLKNTTQFWHGPDNEENFKRDPAPGYTETSITYTFNSVGFRTKEFDFSQDKKKILFFGCSHTEGIGLKVEDTWVHKVSQHFPDHDCYNLGIGGSSADTVSRLMCNLIPLLAPEAVFIYWPPLYRFETYDQIAEEVHPYPNTPLDMSPETMFLYQDAQAFQNAMRNKTIVKLLQNSYKFKLTTIRADEMTEYFSTIPLATDRARDNHVAPSLHTIISDKFINLYNTNANI